MLLKQVYCSDARGVDFGSDMSKDLKIGELKLDLVYTSSTQDHTGVVKVNSPFIALANTLLISANGGRQAFRFTNLF